MSKLVQFVVLTAFGAAAGAAGAQVSAPAPGNPAKKAKDPNEVICERQEETGSRLASRKICMTREQWAQQRRETRSDVERSQQNSGR